MYFLCEMIVSLSIIFTIGGFQIVLLLLIMIPIMYKIAKPYLCADIQMQKVHKSVETPWVSYMLESIRGANIIRAFSQEDKIHAIENKMIDNRTTHFIAHNSCSSWFNLRMTYASQLIPLAAIILCTINKGKVSNVTLCLLFNQVISLRWLPDLFRWINWF